MLIFFSKANFSLHYDYSDVKFREFFCPEIFHEIFQKFQEVNQLTVSICCYAWIALCIPTNLIYYNHVFKSLSHLILKIKSFMKYLKKGSWYNIFQNFQGNFKIFQTEIFHRASLITTTWWSGQKKPQSWTSAENKYDIAQHTETAHHMKRFVWQSYWIIALTFCHSKYVTLHHITTVYQSRIILNY